MALPVNITLLALSFILLPAPVLPAARGTVDQPPPSDAVTIETADNPAEGSIQQNPPHSSGGKRDGIARPEDSSALQSRVQRALRECDLHFQSGKAFLASQRASEARHEFDLAVDALMDLPDNLPDRALLERRAEEFIREIHKYDLESLGAGESPEGLIFTQSPLDGILDLTFPVDPKLKDKVLESVRSSSSELPLVVNDAVLSYINYFSSPRGQRVFLYGWKRAGRYRPMIERVFREEGLPVELIHLAQAESAFMPRALSNKACAGMWQFSRFTGSMYGLNAGVDKDDRLDPEKATRAAARHLHDLYRQTGDWYLAMAGYNCGPLCPERAVQRTGYADFWELYRRSALPKETRNYVPAILAMAIIAKDPSAYGLPPIDQDPELSFDSVHLTTPTSLVLLADAADAPVSDLRELNPSILKAAAPSGTDVRVPKGKGTEVLTALEVVPDSRRLSWRLHRVGSGDTLPLVARRFGIQPASILAANPALDAMWFEQPREGELVLIPTAPKPEPVHKPVRTTPTQRKQGAHGAAVAHGAAKPTLRSSGTSRNVQLAAATHAKTRRTASR
jgi:membrane-bound lytic murein transglycosylase D